MEVFGIERISSEINEVDMELIAQLLCINRSDISRPQEGEIDLLVGMQYAGFHPVKVGANNHLLLMNNRFGTLVAGSHPKVKERARLTQMCMEVKQAVVMKVAGIVDRFSEVEGLGVSCVPRCGACKCGTCHPGGKNMSLKDEREYEMIERGLSFDEARGRWLAQYPWIMPPENLPNNRHVALAVLQTLERRMSKNENQYDLFCRQIQDMLKRGAARLISEKELTSYKGPKFYLTYFPVMNPSSKSTPCRIVFNSSAVFMGHSLNQYLAKGPSLLNALLGVLLRFRQGRYAFIGDIAKMYHSIDIPIRDQMTHLFLWRSDRNEAHPSTYAMTVVNMGDRPSAAIAQIALRKTSEDARSKFPEAADMILKNHYMDDMPASVNSKEEGEKRMSEIESILSPGGFKIKEWIYTGKEVHKEKSKDQDAVQLLMGSDYSEGFDTQSVLGMHWNTKYDTIRFFASLPKHNSKVTKRLVLSTTNKIYDPLGLLTPFTVKLKILMRLIWASKPKIGWDDELPSNLMQQWICIVEEVKQIIILSFERTLKPEGAVGLPLLIIFSDGSEEACGAAAYIRWRIEGTKHYKSRLIAAKGKIAPLKRMDIVRVELDGAVLGKRLRCKIDDEMTIEFEKIIHIVDSEIVKAMVHKDSYGFNTYVGNRVGEIHRATQPDEWMWVAGKLNVADLTTRGCSPTQLETNSVWQEGPEFLTLPEEEWPVEREVRSGIHLPEQKMKFIGLVDSKKEESLLDRFDLSRFSRWKVLLGATALVNKLYKRYKHNSKSSMEVTAEDIEEAENRWIKEAQRGIDVKKLIKLRPVSERGIILVGGRTERWMQATWNQERFVLLPKKHPISSLIIHFEHNQSGHLGVATTIAKVRSKYWILGISKLAKNIVGSCVKCRKKLMKTCSQVMSPLPVERIKPSPPFACVGIDYFGPYTIRGEVQKRVHGKCYGVIFTCLSSRAVHLDISADYSTDEFLKVLRRFGCLRGWPRKVYSDKGTQLVGACRELKEQIENLDWNQVKQFGHKHKFEWVFSPADAPWYNGATEALVKSSKRALNAAIGVSILSFSELQTCMMEAGELVNERPIGKLPSTPADFAYLCPNDLLLGRSSPNIPQGPFKERASNKYRYDFLQQIVNAFWIRWTREVFPNLVIQPKWHTEQRNLREGDIVMVQDNNVLRGQWKIAKVVQAIKSQDGKIRRAVIRCGSDHGGKQEVERAVQRMILLVPVES